MDQNLLKELKSIIVNSIGGGVSAENMPDDFELTGNLLDSMAVTNLILALEEYFDIVFNDDDLSAEYFKDIKTLAGLVQNKLKN